jgi:hypothetical protein
LKVYILKKTGEPPVYTKGQFSSNWSSLVNNLKEWPVIQSRAAVMIEPMETLNEKAAYLSSNRRRRKLNKKMNTPWYKKMSNTLL